VETCTVPVSCDDSVNCASHASLIMFVVVAAVCTVIPYLFSVP
jgi:hypothetical protein